MHRLLFILLSITLTSCWCSKVKRIADMEWPDKRSSYEEDVIRIVYNLTTNLKYREQLRFVDASLRFDKAAHALRIDFTTQRLLEVNEARALLVDIVEDLLDRLNSDIDLRPHMDPYPFSANQLEINICGESFYGVYVDPFYVGWFRLYQGISYFYAFNIMERERDSWSYRKEHYYKSHAFVLAERAAEDHYREKSSGRKDLPEGKEDIFFQSLLDSP